VHFTAVSPGNAGARGVGVRPLLGACLLARVLQGVLEIAASLRHRELHRQIQRGVPETCLHLQRFISVVKLSAGE